MVGLGLTEHYWLEIVLVSVALALATTLVYKFTTKQAIMRELKKEMRSLQQQAKAHKSEPERAMELQKRSMRLNMDYMKHSMKPMLITIIPFFIIFGWLRSAYGDVTVVNLPFSLPFVGNTLGWLGTYIVLSIVFTTLFRKLLKVV